MEPLGAVAAELGLGEIWEKSTLIGADSSVYAGGPPGPPQGWLGVSLAWACLPGVGFYRDVRLAFELSARDPSKSDRELAISKAMEGRRQAEVAIRGPEVEAVRRIAAAAGRMPFPVFAAIDIQGSWAYDFDVAYRRRLAYALAFEASMAVGSLAPFKDRFPVLVSGVSADLAAAVPGAEAPEAFSICLNLLAILDRVRAYERASCGAAPTLPGRLEGAEPKRALLAARLEEAATARMRSLNLDGQAAVRALLLESREIQEQPTYYNGYPPLWGRIAPSGAYYKALDMTQGA
jgi:hypothetical protein